MAIVIGTTYSQTGTRSGGSSNSLVAGIDYLLVSQDNINNTSLIRIRPWIKRPSGNSGTYDSTTRTLEIKAGSQSKTTVFTFDFRSTTVNTKYYLTSSNPFKRSSGSSDPYEFTISHNTDGSKTINLYAYLPLLVSGTSTGNFTVNINVELPTIPRGSTIGDISNFDVESALTIPITKNVSTYYDVLNIYQSDGTTLLTTLNDVKNGDTINLATTLGTTTLYTLMTQNSYNFVFKLSTYTDSTKATQIGSDNVKTISGYLTNANPVFTDYDYEDDNSTTYALTGNRNTIINSYSTLKLSNFTATALKGSSISYWNINNELIANTGSNVYSWTNYSLNNITVYAVDSRGNSTPLTKTISTFIDYFKLTKGSQSGARNGGTSEAVTIEFEGTMWSGSFGSQSNALTVSYKYKETSSSTWTTGTSTITPTISSNNYSFSGAILGDISSGFDVSNSYDIEITVSDKLSSVTFTYLIQAGTPAIALYGNKVALGDKFDESDTTHNVQLNGSVSYNGEDLLSNDDIYYKSGDTFQPSTYMSLTGFVTNSTKYARFTMILPKSLKNITSITVNNFVAEIRGISGYLNSTTGFIEYVGKSGYNFSIEKETDNSIRIQLEKSSAWTNTTNNTPIIAYIRYDSSFTFN